MLIIWLQGIWLPQHGKSFAETPLWAGIAMVPLTVGFLLVGPLAGWLSDRTGARSLATGGLVVSAATFLLLELLPINFSYVWFALLIFLFAVGMGLFFSPNQAAVMNSLPADQRGAGAGMLNTFQNSATVLSMGLFFTIVTLGLASRLPSHLYKGLVSAGVPSTAAHTVANEPPIGALFSAFLGYNPIQELLGPTGALQHLPAKQAAYITGRTFFPKLIEGAFSGGLHLAFTFAAIATVVAIIASAVRGGRYVHTVAAVPVEATVAAAADATVAAAADATAAASNGAASNGAASNGAGRNGAAALANGAPVNGATGNGSTGNTGNGAASNGAAGDASGVAGEAVGEGY
jgi:MFS family permease